MKKTININFHGQLITIEETAYDLLNQYIKSLKEYFSREVEGNEIVNDIETRIAELFGNRLKHGISCITDDDVNSIINTIGRVEDFDAEFGELGDETTVPPSLPKNEERTTPPPPPIEDQESRKLYRKSNDKILGGVCSGLAHYFKIDPVFVRLAFVFLSSLFFWVYIVMWIVVLPKELPNNLSKRLYRNPSDRFIAGVAGGIAAYFRIDTWIPRLIFLLPLLFNMLGWIRIPLNLFSNALFSSSFPFNLSSSINVSFIFLYIILWIIIPEATTVKQKLEMMGEEEYLKSIRDRVSNMTHSRSSRADAAASTTVGASVTPVAQSTTVVDDSIDKQTETGSVNNETTEGGTPPPPPPPYTSYVSAQPQRAGCLNVLIGLVKIVFFGIVGVVVASFMISLFTLIFAGAKLVPLQSLFIDDGFEHILLWGSIILTLLIPFVGVVIWLVRRVMKAKSRPVIGFVVASLWLVGIVAGLTLGFKITRKFNIESLQETTIELTSPSNNKLYVDKARYSDDYFSVTPRTSRFIFDTRRYNSVEFDYLPYLNVEEDSLLFKSIELRIKTSKDTLFHVKTIYSSLDKNYKEAKANLREFDFKLEQSDSVLWIPQFFKTPKEQGYRKQFVVVEIFVPSGSKLEVSEELEDYQYPISSEAMQRRYGRGYGYRNSLEWSFGEEYLLEEETLTETKILTDSI